MMGLLLVCLRGDAVWAASWVAGRTACCCSRLRVHGECAAAASDEKSERPHNRDILEQWADMARCKVDGHSDRDQGCEKDRKSVVEGKSVSVRVDSGGRGIIKKQKTKSEDVT